MKSRSQLALALTAGSTGGSSFGALEKDGEIIIFNLYPVKCNERLHLIRAFKDLTHGAYLSGGASFFSGSASGGISVEEVGKGSSVCAASLPGGTRTFSGSNSETRGGVEVRGTLAKTSCGCCGGGETCLGSMVWNGG